MSNNNKRRREEKEARKRARMVIHRELKEPFISLVDSVNEQDRRFFEEHPGASAYLRMYIPGEFEPHNRYSQDVMVLVQKRSPTMRNRIAMHSAIGGGPYIILKDEQVTTLDGTPVVVHARMVDGRVMTDCDFDGPEAARLSSGASPWNL